jgi:hypothetical protein
MTINKKNKKENELVSSNIDGSKKSVDESERKTIEKEIRINNNLFMDKFLK